MDYNAKQGTISDLENTQVQSVESCNISVYTFFFLSCIFSSSPCCQPFPRHESELGDFQFKPIRPFGFLRM